MSIRYSFYLYSDIVDKTDIGVIGVFLYEITSISFIYEKFK